MMIQQLSVFLENRAGQLSAVTELLAQNHVDMQALNIAETADYGVLRLIVDMPPRAAIRRMTESVKSLFFLLISCMANSSFFPCWPPVTLRRPERSDPFSWKGQRTKAPERE